MQTYLFLEWKSFGNSFIRRAFEAEGFTAVPYEITHNADTRKDAALTEELARTIINGDYAFVFSYNYFPVAAIACQACKVFYVSWVYDSPFVQLYSQTITYDTNAAFVFDKDTVIDLQKKGVKNVFYLPMAADTDYYDSLTDEASNQKYAGDIAFVGTLYGTDRFNLFRHFEKLDEYSKGFIEALINIQENVYGYNFLERALTKELVEKIQKVCPVYGNPDGLESAEWVIANYFLAPRITARERLRLLKTMGERLGADKVKLYCPLENGPDYLTVCQGAEYEKEAPYVYKNTKVNLNISLKSIKTGIPLRIFDIFGNKGFALSNYQDDFNEFFTAGEDFDFYESIDDAIKKTQYYLEHEEKRAAMAQSAYDKVKAGHTYRHRVCEMLNILGA